METPSRTIHCFRADKESRSGRPGAKETLERRAKSLKAIYCKMCGTVVTSRDQQLSVNNSHTHTFFNPAGIVFELGCFKKAPGCQIVGDPSSEFTWFAGYLWTLSLCGNCRAHLGWYFEGKEKTFFALILTNLME
ncbi:MAG: hypothetical protein GY702_13005 [Desulfobulbaceae bacterium]|nr:hypothetical protein [Desulfobulbaceae bacterium]